MRKRKVYDSFMPKIKKIEKYRMMFKKAFPPDGNITHARMAIAIGQFERSLLSNSTPFDRYLKGDKGAMTMEARAGLAVFKGKGGCTNCHGGLHLTNFGLHRIGVKSDDPGRGGAMMKSAKNKVKKAKGAAEMAAAKKNLAAVTKEAMKWKGVFKTPGLRNVALTAPYMHDGSIGTLEQVVEFYNRGGDIADRRDPLITPLNLTNKEKWDLVAFLYNLTDTKVNEMRPPDIP